MCSTARSSESTTAAAMSYERYSVSQSSVVASTTVARVSLAYAKDTKATVVEATLDDWDTEYLSYDIAAAVVDSLDKAVEHIRLWTSGHTEAIVTTSQQAARRFTQLVDSTTVAVNASTRFTDGGQFGFGAEIGISTQKLHARGPMGLPELTSTKYIVTGDGHVRR